MERYQNCVCPRNGTSYLLQSHLIIKSIEVHAVTCTSTINLHSIDIKCPPSPLGNLIEELIVNILLSLFPSDGTSFTLLGDFSLLSDKLQSSCLCSFLYSFLPNLEWLHFNTQERTWTWSSADCL